MDPERRREKTKAAQNIFVKVRAGRENASKIFSQWSVRAEKKINFCVPRGPPPHRAAEPGPPRHAKIGKNHRNQRSTAKK